MPELHSNQIAWQAPELPKADFESPNYMPLADAFDTLGRAADEFAKYQQRINDIDAKNSLNQLADEGLVELERYEPSDNNYKPALDKFNKSLQEKFASFDMATQNRFAKDYPTYMDEQKLKAETLVFEKQQKFAIRKTSEMIPLLASNVTEGKQSYEDARKELEYMTANMNNAVAEEMLFTFDNQVQIGNLNNLIYEGQYQDAIDLLESPKDSDTFTPEFRSDTKARIQKIMNDEVKARDALKKQLTKDIEDQTKDGLVNTLLYALDRKDNSYARVLKLLDDPKSKVPLSDGQGNVVGYITAKDIPVAIRREAMKKAGEYEGDSMSWRINSNKAHILADNFEKQYMGAQKKRLSGEIFNNIYAFTQTEDFYYLNKEDRDKMLDIVYGQVNRHNEQVIPYEGFRSDDAGYNTTLYFGTKEWEGPSSAKAVRDMIFRDITADVMIDPMKTGNITNLRKDPEQRWFRTLTSKLRDTYEKETGTTVKYGSEYEYLMNQYASLLSASPEERASVGLAGATDEQIGLTYSLKLGEMERDGTGNRIIGQNMTTDEATQVRKNIFDSFYTLLNNGNNPELTDEQKKIKQRWYDKLATATFGTGARAFGFTSTEMGVSNESLVYPQPLTNSFYKQIEKYNKGE